MTMTQNPTPTDAIRVLEHLAPATLYQSATDELMRLEQQAAQISALCGLYLKDRAEASE